MRYNFPPIKGIENIPLSKQLQKIAEECQELVEAKTELEQLEELLDLLHAVETALRIFEQFANVDQMIELVIEKNKERGYYDDGVGEA